MPVAAEVRWAVVLGFALGGFFDGILLHQVLQWHHLLSLAPGVESLRAQILWDGWFHVAMYGVALAGLWGLWRGRTRADKASSRALWAAVLVGFGLWNVVDIGLAHWVLGIHRVRLDTPDPLTWDLIWLTAFGAAPILAGWALWRRSGGSGGGRPAAASVAGLGLLVVAAGAWAAKPPREQPFTTVVFAPSVSAQAALQAVAAADADLVWSDPTGGVLVVSVAAERRLSFYRRGALLVGGAGAGAACVNWTKV